MSEITENYKAIEEVITRMSSNSVGLPLLGDNVQTAERHVMSLRDKYNDAKQMIDSVYELIEIYWQAEGTHNQNLKKEWLRKAREIHEAIPWL